jgi:hypothetical protein
LGRLKSSKRNIKCLLKVRLAELNVPSNRSDSSNGRGRVIKTPKHKHQISSSVFFF